MPTITGPRANVRDLINTVGAACLTTHFQDQSPDYPTFLVLITGANIKQAAQDALRAIAGQNRSKQAAAVLDALELLDDDNKIDPSHSRYAKWVMEIVRQKGHGQVVNRSELIGIINDIEYMAPQSFRLEPEWAVVIISSLVYSGDLVLSVSGYSKFDATALTTLATAPIDDLARFKHVERPKDWNMPGLKALFELLELAPGNAQLVTQGNETPVQEMQKKAGTLIERIVTASQDISDGLPFWGKPMLGTDDCSRINSALDQIKKFLESLQPFSTPGKLKNFRHDVAEIKQNEAGLKALENIDSLKSWVGSVGPIAQYLSLAAEMFPEDHEWSKTMRSTRDSILIQIGDVKKRTVPAFRQEVMQKINSLKSSYIENYLAWHGKARLGANDDKRKGALLRDCRIGILQSLCAINLLPKQQFADLQNRIAGFKSCFALTTKDLQSTHICPHCLFKPITEPANSPVGKILDKLDDEADNLLTAWTQTLLSNLEDSATQKNLSLLKTGDRKLVDLFLKKKKLPDEISKEFIHAVNEALEGLIRVSVRTDDITKALVADGTPTIPVELKKRFNDYIDSLAKGKDTAKIRIVLE